MGTEKAVTRRTKLFILMILGVLTYVVLMSVRPHIANPALRSAAGIVAAISIGVSLITALRIGRSRGG